MQNIQSKAKRLLKNPIFWAKFLGYAIPIAFLAYVLYQNYLPFGYSKSFTIEVGSESDTQVSEFYLEPSQNLSERKTDEKGNPYRELHGLASVVFKPNAILKNATITVESTDPGVSLIPPFIDFDPASSTWWDLSYDFTKGVPAELKNNKAFLFDEATYFDGTARVELPSSSDKFENGPLSVYAEWMPANSENDSQQIVGHYNWELSQNKNSVSFQVGRMNDAKGPIYKIHSIINKDFWGKKHSALAIYNPGENGYIELYVDGKFADRTYFGTSTIWGDYGKNNMSFGKSAHGSANFFKGNLYNVNISSKNLLEQKSYIRFPIFEKQTIQIPFISETTSTLRKVILHADKK